MSKEVVNQVKQYRVSDLRKHPNNPRIIKDNQYNTLKASIEANPELLEARPVILSDRTGKLTIIGGNQRFQVVKDLGWLTIPGVLFPDLTEEKERELMIRDNVSNGEWDFQILAADWDSAQLQEWGLDVPDWGDEEGGYGTEDASVPVQRFIIEVECASEKDRQDIFTQLVDKMGLNCKAV